MQVMLVELSFVIIQAFERHVEACLVNCAPPKNCKITDENIGDKMQT
jgi:hypothetical protein